MSFAYLPAVMTVLSSAFNMAGQQASQNANVTAAKNRQVAANYEADQLDVNAGQQQAASQRTAADQQRTGQLTDSRLVALAAAQGGGTTDPTVLGLRAKIMAEAAYRSQAAMYQGDEAARTMKAQADAKRMQAAAGVSAAEAGQKSSNMAQMAGMFRTGATMYEKYGGGGPAAPDEGNYQVGTPTYSGNYLEFQ